MVAVPFRQPPQMGCFWLYLSKWRQLGRCVPGPPEEYFSAALITQVQALSFGAPRGNEMSTR